MESKLLTNEDKDDNSNVVPFVRPKPASGDPNDPVWLNNLGFGTIFLARKKNVTDFILGMFCIEGKTEKSVFLLEQSMGDKNIAIDPRRFCSQYECFEIL